jgi:DNA-nicking Smr family endonuclease
MAKPRSRPGGTAAPDATAPKASDAESPRVETEEARLFRAAVRDVKPLAAVLPPGAAPPRPRRRVPRVEWPGAAAPGADASGGAALGDVVAEDGAPGAADPLSFRRPGVRDRTLRQLRRGRYPVEGELDLHGLSQAGARDQLADFIAASRQAGLRCVRIVHGKGYRSGARGPVLKISVNTWLKRHADVLAFTSARPIDGGTGAVYVLLR